MSEMKKLQPNKYINTLISILFGFSILLILYFHHIIKTDIVFTHLFYIPIIISGIYWKKKGFIVAISLALLLILSQKIAGNSDVIIDVMRASVFVFTSLVTIYLSTKYDKLQNEFYALKLQESENKFKIFIDNTYDWEYWKNKDGSYVYMSPSCYRISGYTREEFLENYKMFETIVFEEDKEIYLSHIKSIWENITSEDIDFRIVRKDGKIVWINMTNTLIKDNAGNVIGIRGSNRDITERKDYESKIIHLNEQLNEQLITKDKFFSIIAHDLRSPLSGFLGLTEIMKDMDLDTLDKDEFKEFNLSLNESARNIFGLLENLLEWSRFQRGMISFKPELIFLKMLMDENIGIQKSILKNKNLKVENNITSNISCIVDIQMINTVIRNIFSNAIKFTNKGGIIKFDATDNGSSIILSIKDNGIGIPKDIINKMFKVEHKISRLGTDGESSTGLGLILCKEYVTKHNGEIWVTSVEGKGSTFLIKLPK